MLVDGLWVRRWNIPLQRQGARCTSVLLHNLTLPGCYVLLGLLQRSFKATPVPGHVHEARAEAMMAANEASKLAAKVKAEMARERAARVLEETQQQRWVDLLAAYTAQQPQKEVQQQYTFCNGMV